MNPKYHVGQTVCIGEIEVIIKEIRIHKRSNDVYAIGYICDIGQGMEIEAFEGELDEFQ